MSAYGWRWRSGSASPLNWEGERRSNSSTHRLWLKRKRVSLKKQGWNLRMRIYGWRLKIRPASLNRIDRNTMKRIRRIWRHKSKHALSKMQGEIFLPKTKNPKMENLLKTKKTNNNKWFFFWSSWWLGGGIKKITMVGNFRVIKGLTLVMIYYVSL